MKHKLIQTLNVISVVLLCCTLLCGGWVATHPTSDLSFHATMSAVSVVIALLTIFINMLKCKHCKKN